MASNVMKDIITSGGTSIHPCSCVHQFQDERYGVGRRLHNDMREGGYRCTVCSATKDKVRAHTPAVRLVISE